MTEHELDQLIDRALANHAAAAPPGLASRVLRRVRRPARWMPWAITAAAAVIVFVAVPEAADVPRPALIAHWPTVPVLPATAVVIPRGVAGRVRPAGIGLSAQERQLEKLLQAYPDLAQQLAAETPLERAKPVDVPSLEFPPITIESLESVD